ncbi:MAG: helix-turn-helix domain-containing protein [Roseibium sp.]|uniref:helix-turn-helix domain-containing protein n=1 Tax=Roseibium sp. TaxID=1936156 RepID=UPI00262D7C4A|nr:helix-turn-helix transcriptional regulator [Roseibium sp.]MCV0427249.1 helix-turn-helix domain-containing protein [Roseibium sp.]
MAKKKADDVDVYVGKRIRARRINLGETQEGLGRKLGVSFQQIQKYERGANRVSASRLLTFAKVLSVPVTFFYEGAPGTEKLLVPVAGSEAISDLIMSNDESLQLNLAFSRINDSCLRENFILLACAIASSTGVSRAEKICNCEEGEGNIGDELPPLKLIRRGDVSSA